MAIIQLVSRRTIYASEIVAMLRDFIWGVIHASGSGEVDARIVCACVDVNLTLVSWNKNEWEKINTVKSLILDAPNPQT